MSEMDEQERTPMVRQGELLPAPHAPSSGHGQQSGYGYGPDLQDDEPGGGLMDYWRILKRRKGALILAASLGLIAGILITVPQTPVYQASTTLEVLELNQNFMNMKEVQQVTESSWNLMMDIQTQLKVLQSDSLRDRVLAELKAKPGAVENPAGGRVSAWRRALNLPEPEPHTAREQALAMASRTLLARASGQTKIIELLVDSTDPKVASDYANRLAQDYIDQNMESRWQMTQRTGEFLAKQLDEMRIKLERSEDGLQEYARRSGLLVSSDEKTNISESKLKQIQDSLVAVHADRITRQSRWEMASTAPAESLPDVLNDVNMREYMTKLTELRRQRAELMQTYTADYPRVKRVDAQIAELQKGFEQEKSATLRRIKNEYDEAIHKEALLEQDYRKQTGLVTDQGEKAIQYNILKREVDTNRSLYEGMLQRVKESSIASAMRASNVRVLDASKPPTSPYKPKVPQSAAAGMLGGLFLGIVVVVITDKANRTLQDPSDVGFYLQVPELGMIPSQEAAQVKKHRYFAKSDQKLLTAGDGEAKLEMVTYQRKPSMMAESFRATLTSILFSSSNGGRPKMLVVTSASPGEGKTTVAANLAIATAETGQRVLLIDADTRKPRIHDIFDVANDSGLTSLLQARNGSSGPAAKTAEAQPVDGVADGVIRQTEVPGLFVLPSGPAVAGPTNLLYSKRLGDYLKRFRDDFDMIFVDTPPMLQIPDARVIGKLASGVVLVVRANVTTRDAAMAARARLREDGIHVIGTVMNDWNPKNSSGGYYGYYDGHYSKYYRKYYRHDEEA